MSLAPRRRGACPALSAPMQTGDGLLVRLMPQGGLSPDQLAGFADAAARFGNGILEVTARGSLQLRGLRPETVGPLNAAVSALAIYAREGLAIDLSPLSGLDAGEAADARGLAANLRQALAQAGFAAGLGPKVSVVMDGGGAIALDGLKADIRLAAEAGGWRLTPGDGVLGPDDAIAATRDLLAHIAALGPAARMSDVMGVPAPASLRAPAAPGTAIALKDGTFALPVALPFGAVEHGQLAALIEAAARFGAVDLRPAPPRLLLAVGLGLSAVGALRAEAAALGFICDPVDPRLFVAACPGTPLCASGRLPARALGTEVAKALAPVLDAGRMVHLSGCEKGCAHPAPAWLTLSGREAKGGMDSAVALVQHGTAAAPAGRHVPVADFHRWLDRLAVAAQQERAAGDDLLNSLLEEASLERTV